MFDLLNIVDLEYVWTAELDVIVGRARLEEVHRERNASGGSEDLLNLLFPWRFNLFGGEKGFDHR